MLRIKLILCRLRLRAELKGKRGRGRCPATNLGVRVLRDDSPILRLDQKDAVLIHADDDLLHRRLRLLRIGELARREERGPVVIPLLHQTNVVQLRLLRGLSVVALVLRKDALLPFRRLLGRKQRLGDEVLQVVADGRSGITYGTVSTDEKRQKERKITSETQTSASPCYGPHTPPGVGNPRAAPHRPHYRGTCRQQRWPPPAGTHTDGPPDPSSRWSRPQRTPAS